MTRIQLFKGKLLEKAAEKYARGEWSFSRAAGEAGVSVYELEAFLASKGYRHAQAADEFAHEVERARKAIRA